MDETLKREEIDERILRLLGLEDTFDIDYDTYFTLLREAIAKRSFGDNKISEEELAMLANERKRVRGNKGRFTIKKKGTINADNVGSLNFGRKSNLLLPAAKSLDLKPKTEEKKEEIDYLSRIDSTLKSILSSVQAIYGLQKKETERNRRSRETTRRGERESNLEKILGKSKEIVDKVTEPVRGFLSRIFDFLFKALLARAFLKFVNWLSDPANQEKLDSIIRFLVDKWPILIAAYLRFGTGLGKLVGFLTKFLIRGGIKLAAAAASLLAKAGLKKFAGAAKFLGGPKGRLLGAGLQLGATVATTMAVSQGLESLGKPSAPEEGTEDDTGEVPKFNGGGFVRFNNNFLKSLGGFFTGQQMQEGGYVSGTKGVDKVPAMLSDGEFVMSAGAVQKYGVGTLKSMNAAGGGSNVPKVVKGKVHAEGGGYIGVDKKTDPSSRKNERLLDSQKKKEEEIVERTLNFSTNNKYPDVNIEGSQYNIESSSNVNPIIKFVKQYVDSNVKKYSIESHKFNHKSNTFNSLSPSFGYNTFNSLSPSFGYNSFNNLNKSYTYNKNISRPIRRTARYIGENYGRDIKGATADRQHALVQPGEYLLTKDAVDKVGKFNLDSFVANLDSNSTPAKEGMRNLQVTNKFNFRNILKIPEINPYSGTSSGGMMTLPPINLGSQGMNQGPNASSASEVPDFSAVSGDSMEYREAKRQILGLI